jgi:hypothetical protein
MSQIKDMQTGADGDNFVERRQEGNVSQEEYMKLAKEN